MSERTPEALLWDFLRGAMMTQALAIACELRIPHALAGGPRHVEHLAHETGVDGDALHRVLRALASDGVFAEAESGVFANTSASEAVRDEAWTSFAHLFGGVFYGAVGDLAGAVRTGRPTFASTFGAEYWPWLAAHADERVEFDRAMGGGKDRKAEHLAALEWRDDEVVVDVGGGNGSLLLALLQRKPNVRGIVFDLPETDRDESSFPDRLEFVAGSFFERVPRGNTYLLSGILHDWDDEQAAAICRTIRTAASPDARLLIAESVIPPGNEPEGAKWLDLLMLVLAGGRERTEPEWRELLGSTGFDVEQIESGLIQARCR
jgi:O-methyltransferase/methyltransferase family protein